MDKLDERDLAIKLQKYKADNVELSKKYLANRLKVLSRLTIPELNSIINGLEPTYITKELISFNSKDKYISWNTIIHDILELAGNLREDQSHLDIKKGLEPDYFDALNTIYADIKVLLYDISIIRESIATSYQFVDDPSKLFFYN